MDMNEQYVPWVSDWPSISCLYFGRLQDDLDGLSVEFCNNNREPLIAIHFGQVLAYRVLDEQYRLVLLRRLQQNNIKGSYFIVQGSNWLNWFHEESEGIQRGRSLKHFLILTADLVIDVISDHMPNVQNKEERGTGI